MDEKTIVWIGSSRDDVRRFPREARRKAGLELRAVQRGQEPTDFKPIPSVGSGVYEIRIHAHELIVFSMSLSLRRQFMYSTRSKRKRKKRPSTTSRLADSVIERRNTVTKRGHKARGIQLIRGSDNVFEDVGFEAVEAANLKVSCCR